MDIFLPPDLTNIIQQRVDNGSFPSATDVVREGLRLKPGAIELLDALNPSAMFP